MGMVQQQFVNLESFEYMFELSYSKKENMNLYNNDIIQTEYLFGGIATVIFSTKFGVAPRPIIT